MKNKYSVAIIGCGSIGALKPDRYDSPTGYSVLTHAHAFSLQKERISEIYFIDTDFDKAEKAAAKWGGRAINCWPDCAIDIVVISVPTKWHFTVLNRIVNEDYYSTPRIIIAEKPFCFHLGEAAAISIRARHNKISILVNYTRRFNPIIKALKEKMNRGDLGEIYSCTVNYSDGLMRSGSHAVDLMRFFFGEAEGGQLLMNGKIIDRDKDDPTVGAYFGFEKCKHVVFNPVDGRAYSIFEVDILHEKGRTVLFDKGRKIIEHCIIETECSINTDSKYVATGSIIQKTDLEKTLANVANEAIAFLDGEVSQLTCTDADAIEVHKIIESATDDVFKR